MPTNNLRFNPNTEGATNSDWISKTGAIILDKEGNDVDETNPLPVQSSGDAVLNDTQGIWGTVKSVDSETALTVHRMQDGAIGQYKNIVGDSYRIARPASTGAAVVASERILNVEREEVGTVFHILNGTSNVDRTVNCCRCSRGKVILAGSGGAAAGTITARQATTTANVFYVMPAGFNRTLVAADTVPKGKTFLIRNINVSVSRSSGAAGSATISLRSRPRGSVFQSDRVYEVQTGGPLVEDIEGGIVIGEGSDIKFRVDAVSDNDTIAQAEYEYIILDN